MIVRNRFLKTISLFAILLIIVSVPASLWAGTTGKIAGRVIDANSGDPLAGVNILVDGTQMGAATDLDGTFFILNVPPGKYNVRATMVGYGEVVQQSVVISADITTTLNFTLKESIMQGEEVVIVAKRPLVQKDVAAGQSITTSSEASELPVSDIMEAVNLEPGVTVAENRMEVSIRGGGSDQISFQVDGMERTDKLNNKTYTPTNSATVQEIQVLKGGFSAEYGNIRSGMFNVVTKEGGPQFSGSVDYRIAPAHQKHFGPNAYGTDQYDYQTYGTSKSMNPVVDVEGNQIFSGWNEQATSKNASSWMGKDDWTPEELQEVWKYRHRPIEYANAPDHYLDFGVGGPLGIKNAGFLVGVKYNRILPILPSVRGYDQIMSFEGKAHFKPTASMKLTFNALYGKTETSTTGDGWGNFPVMSYGTDIDNAAAASNPAVGINKYYIDANELLDVTTQQLGFKFTHTLSPSTFYELRYSYFTSKNEVSKADPRNPAGVKNIGGVEFDEAPVGWVHGSASLMDIPGTYAFSGGGRLEDNSSVKSHLINFDMTSQINSQHMVKFGAMFGSDHVIRDNHVFSTIILEPDAGNFSNFDNTPYRMAAYVQDKMEYGGLIANVGLRLEHYAANGYLYDPNNPYSPLWVRGGSAGYETPDDIEPKEKSKSYTYLAPRISFSHPVGENTKFFFNYGIYYSEPATSYRFGLTSESWAFGNYAGDLRQAGNPNLEPPKTSAYEIGFEQSIGDQWLIRAYFYSKDNTQQLGSAYYRGMDGGLVIGSFSNWVSSGGGSAHQTYENNQYQDIRGIEMKITKRIGRFFTGWINMNYLISTKGYYGYQVYNQDPLAAYLSYAAAKEQPQTTPSFIANLNFHTPKDWGQLKGDWILSINQYWTKGAKVIYNPTGLPTREVNTIYYWADNYSTNLRLSKSLKLTESINLRLYMDVRNVFNYERLNINVLNSAERERYYTNYIDGESGLDEKIGNMEDKNGNNVFTENWVDKNGVSRAPIAPSKDFALAYNPRSFLFGIKIEF